MKKKLFLLSALALMMAGGIFWSCQKDEMLTNTDVLKVKEAVLPSIEPILVTDWQSGNAASECAQAANYGEAGCVDEIIYSYKFDNWVSSYSGPYDVSEAGLANTITITNNNGMSFDWESDQPVCRIVVKGGPYAYVYVVDGATSGTGLIAPNNEGGNQSAISHVSFCFYEGFGAPPCEWVGETAWAAGNRYVTRGNWATNTPYGGSAKSVKLYAGQTIDAGTVNFSAPSGGKVTITIELNSGFRLEEFEGVVIEEAVKIQGYPSAPKANPAPGLFTTYKGTSLVVEVSQFAFYGVHVNVEREVCPEL
jgi:hypothetical protein